MRCSTGRGVAYPAVPQAPDNIPQGQQALVDRAAFCLPQLVVSIVFSSQRAALTPGQIHKVQCGDLQGKTTLFWKRKEKAMPFGVNLMRSQGLEWRPAMEKKKPWVPGCAPGRMDTSKGKAVGNRPALVGDLSVTR